MNFFSLNSSNDDKLILINFYELIKKAFIKKREIKKKKKPN